MFGFVSRVSPKAMLASSLARALSTFFDVDPATVETNLLQDTHISLHNVKLKPLPVNPISTMVGCVQEIEFSWIWGGDERTAIVRETRLTIRGARFRILLNPQEQGGQEDDTNAAHYREKVPPSDEQQDLSYLQRIVQQVVDHLTLVITDVELTIQVSSDAKIVLEVSNLGLVSFGRTEESPLSQRISLGSFRAHVFDDKTETKVPLIDSVGYAASIKRVSGRRFVDGLIHGLKIVGEENDENAGVVLHAGRKQVQALCQMMDLLLADKKNRTTVSLPDSQGDKLAKYGLLEDEVFEDAREALEEENSIQDDNASTTKSPSPSTTFELPLPSVTILLPNESKISMPNCMIHYTADGSVCRMQGCQGIKINDDISLVTFLSKANKASWLVDFCTNKILLAKDQDEKIIANVVWRDDEIKRLMTGFRQVVEATPVSVTERVEDAWHDVTSSPIETEESQPWSVVAQGFIHLRVQDDNEEWIEAMIESPSLELLGSAVSNVGIWSVSLGPTSFGEATIRIPRIYQSTEQQYYFIEGPVEAFVESAVVADNIQAFLARVLTLDSLSTSHTPGDTQTRLPYRFRIPGANMTVHQPGMSVVAEDVKTCDSQVLCQSIEYKDASGVFGRVTDVAANLTAPIQVTAAVIESLHIPGIANLPEPVSGMSLSYSDGLLRVNISSLNLITPLISKSRSSEASKANKGQDEFTLPCAINLHLDELLLRSTNMDCSVCIHPVDIVVASTNVISIDATGPMTIQLASSSSDDCLKTIIGSSSAVLCPSEKGYTVGSCSCSGIQVEPTSSFRMTANIPVVSTTTNEPITVGGSVNVSVQSFEVLERVQTLFNRFFPSDASSDQTPLLLPEVKLSIADIRTKLVADSVTVKDNEMSCERLVANEGSGMSAALSGIRGAFGSKVTIGIEWIETMYIPGVCTLQKPVHHTTAAFVGESLCVNIGTVYAMSLGTSNESTRLQQTQNARTDSAMVAPFPIRVSLKELTLNFPISNNNDTFLRKIELDIKPADIDPFSLERSPQGTSLHMSVDRVENKMMKLETVCTAGTVYNGDLNVVHRFAFAAKNAVVVAGFSSLDWSNMFGDEKEKVPVMLPFASMEPFTAHLVLQGNVVATRIDVNVPLFHGDANSNSDDLIRHLTSSILSKAPSVITNSEFLGENVVEMSTKTGGRALMASTVAGSAVGSVGGLVAVDSIRGAISSGKKSRNASIEDRYHFGDVSRGTIRSVAQAAKTGGQARRGSSDSYRVGDFTVGASRSACEYASENKSRLSAATGSGVGMAVAAALGPVGLVGMAGVVAGGYVGSKLGGSVFENDGKHSSSSGGSKRENDYGTNQGSAFAPTAPIGGDEDLLGLNTPTAFEERNRSSTMATRPSSMQTAPLGGDEDLLGLNTPTTFEEQSRSSTRPGLMPKSAISAPFVTSEEANALTNSPVAHPNREPHARTGDPPAKTRLQPPNRVATSSVPRQYPQAAQPHEGYRFGDLTKSVVARGKKKDGRSESEGYKFGDFTRGLFG